MNGALDVPCAEALSIGKRSRAIMLHGTWFKSYLDASRKIDLGMVMLSRVQIL